MPQYICVECGRIFDDEDTIINPDGEANCSECYNSSKWFYEPERKETMNAIASEKKRHWWSRGEK